MVDSFSIKLSCKEIGCFDLVVVGGGCTGVFAAIRAARLGLKVAIVGKSNCFGGVATNGLVNVWHTLFDTDGKEQIIAGLTDEVEQMLFRNGSAEQFNTKSVGIRFDPNALKFILDQLVLENMIKIFFHTFYSSLVVKDNRIQQIIVSNKEGLGTIRANFFIDASGDGDLCRDAGLSSYVSSAVQPPSPGCFLNGKIKNINELIIDHGDEFGLEDDWGWGGKVPGAEGIFFRADFHVFGKMCNRTDDLTEAEIEGRRKLYALASLLKKYEDPNLAVVALCSQIGVRETVHFQTRFQASELDLLLGRSYEDTVMRGTYRVDVHHQQDNGITFKYLDGEVKSVYGKSNRTVFGNWRKEKGISSPPALYYQVPFEILVQDKIENLIPVGRMINADEGAFGALRVMVNLNQLGEAAGVAAYLSLNAGVPISSVCGKKVQELLRKGGSV